MIGPLDSLLACDLRDTRGAAHILSERRGKSVSIETIHNFVRAGKLHAYVFGEDGVLIERDEKQTRRAGQALFFDVKELMDVEVPHDTAGRPAKK